MKEFCRDHGYRCDIKRFDEKTMGWEGPRDYPTIKSVIKGMQTKILCRFLCHQTSIMISDGTDQRPDAQIRLELVGTFQRFIRILDSSGGLLTEATARGAEMAGQRFIDIYQELAWVAFCKRKCLYKVRPKFHYLAHLIEWLPKFCENPAKLDLMAAEDFVGKVKAIARKCHASTVSLRVVERMLLFLGVRCASRRG